MAELGVLSNLRVERGLAPDAGFERGGLATAPGGRDFLSSIAAARQEAQTLFELSQDLGNSLSLGETLSVLSIRMSKLIPSDTIATFICRDHHLVPELVSGDNFRLFAALRIPIGDGLCGWVARNRKPIINGNPAVESGYVADEKSATLRSAIAVPLEGVGGVVGVLALYKAEGDFVTTDHLRILQAVSSKVALSIENALRYEQAENCAVTDYLTGLPNARSLFMHLDKEIARCQRTNTSVAVMVCDLDGFKQINDCYGHMEGDKALKYFAKHLKDTSREYDYVARMGGDEFVIVAPGLKSEAVADKVAQMNALAVDAGRQACGKEILSLSVGTAFCPQDGFDAERLLAEADRRMYTVKQLHHEHSSSINHLIATRATWTTVH
jgi:diguanylate cyclase (GGDEF)-like protein